MTDSIVWHVSGTSVWYLGGVDPATTIAFFFEVTNTNATPLPPHKRRYMQFLTSYQAASGRFRLRVTTVCGLWHSDPADHLTRMESYSLCSIILDLSIQCRIYISDQ